MKLATKVILAGVVLDRDGVGKEGEVLGGRWEGSLAAGAVVCFVGAQSSIGYWLGWRGAGSQTHIQRPDQRGDVHATNVRPVLNSFLPMSLGLVDGDC